MPMKCEYCPCEFPDSMDGLVEKTFHELICIDEHDIKPKTDWSRWWHVWQSESEGGD